MKVTVSDRDKRLLYLLISALLFVVFVRFALMPCIAQTGVLQEQLAAAEQTKAEMEMQIATLATADDNIAAAQQRLAEKNSAYYDIMTNDALDDLVTGMILDGNLAAMSLRITGAEVLPVQPYFASPLVQANKVQQGAQPAAGAQATDVPIITDGAPLAQLPYVPPMASNNENYISTAIVECSVSGQRADFVALLTKIQRDYPAIRVQRFTMTNIPYLDETLAVQTGTQYTCTLYVYMCNKAGDTL